MKTLEQKKADLKKITEGLSNPHIPENVKPKMREVIAKLEKEIQEEEGTKKPVVEIDEPVVVEPKKPAKKKQVKRTTKKTTSKKKTAKKPVEKKPVEEKPIEKKPKKKVSEKVNERVSKIAEKKAKQRAKQKAENEKRVFSILKKIEADKGTLKKSDLMKLANEINDLRLPWVAKKDKENTSKKRLAVTRNNVLRWGLTPGRYDLIGIDCLKSAEPSVVAREITKAKIRDFFGL
jgi:hypothetical protein